ncbi:MAG: helix-turn-helix transcriptional regulator [Candidatus Kapabacteria bacterium]|nr:helix-turn-helix transcriptional regulator [Candidatus Kapabacteria bacterium]
MTSPQPSPAERELLSGRGTQRAEGSGSVSVWIELERNIVPLESKRELEKQWTEVHGAFIDHLKMTYPLLSAMELKIAALLKMKLSTSNISAILFLSKRTVEFHRLNIRKKMGLSPTDNLHVLLNKQW